MRRLLFAVLLTMGCVPVALPPMRADLGGGVVHATNASAVSDFTASATITPLGGIEETHKRPIDFGFGGHLDYGRGGYRDVGFHAELAPIIARGPIGKGEGRWSFRGQYRLTRPNSRDWAHGFAIGLGGELVGFVRDEPAASSNFFGIFHGEGGIGGFVEYARVADGGYHVWSVTTGISIRIPALLGIAIIK